MYLALQCCPSLQNVLGAVNISQIGHWDALHNLCTEVHEYFIRRFDSDTVLPVEGAHICSTLNDLAQSHDVSEDLYSPSSKDA